MEQDPGKVTCPHCEGLGVEDPEMDPADDCYFCEGDGIVKGIKASLYQYLYEDVDGRGVYDPALIKELADFVIAENTVEDYAEHLMKYPVTPEDAYPDESFAAHVRGYSKENHYVKPYSKEDKKVLQEIEDRMWYGHAVPGTSIVKNPCCEITNKVVYSTPNPKYNAVKNNYNPNDDYSIFLR